jgi:hypothetical protein
MNNLSRTLSRMLPLAALSAACGMGRLTVYTGSGNVIREDRPVSSFSTIVLEGAAEVVINQGASESLTIEAEDNLLPLIASEVSDGVLHLYLGRPGSRDVVSPTQPIRFLVGVKDLGALYLAGRGSIHAGALQVPNLKVNMSGSGDVTLDELRAETLTVTLNASGNFTASGETHRLEVFLEGTDQVVDAGDLESQTALVSLGGEGDVTIWVRSQLDVSISGTGTVNYFGQPTIGKRNITGSGDINPMGDK